MKTTENETIYLKNYQKPPFIVEKVSLTFHLKPTATQVVALVTYHRQQPNATLELDGIGLQLLNIQCNGKPLSPADYQQYDTGLSITNLPNSFELAITTQINPQDNTALEGLYRSSDNYCSQCEAQGFRRITYYQDRPDIMAVFSVKIIADKATNPVLLSNGNPINAGNLANGLHFAEWHDPFAKPCYLFALVAGNLAKVEDSFTTQSGRNITLQIYTEPHHIHQCDFAMASLKRAMLWDEQRFNLQYDLDLFMIVAVDDFNMGAMENKGLNIFNSRLVFASPETATDDDYIAIEAVIGHEYFHNWTGNRITCRDWFQLSLKEGLTVFRDQEFTADHHARAVKRIEDVRLLRTHQFAEDASPMAHPIRPASYIEINNFYTVTVYEKGAEVVRLYHTLLGEDGFQKGMALYIQRHDGQAVTTEDFLNAMADANGRDLSQMKHWYNQAGTPTLKIRMDYDAKRQRCTLHCQQSSPLHYKKQHQAPFLIPIRIALLGETGNMLMPEQTLLLHQEKQTFHFDNIPQRPIPSLLRDFSAPVILDNAYSEQEHAFLMRYDNNAFNRWAAAQALANQSILCLLANPHYALNTISQAFQTLLHDDALEPALKAEALTLPSLSDLQEAWLQQHDCVNPVALFTAKEQLHQHLGKSLAADFKHIYHTMQGATGLSDAAMQQRKLQNICLAYLMHSPHADLAYQQFQAADNMTHQYAALHLLTHHQHPEQAQALQAFAAQWANEASVMDKWFAIQATSPAPQALAQVQSLMQHPAFSLKNPNKVRALIGSFAKHNPMNFHAQDGSGYQFIAAQVLLLDALNPQISARLVRALMDWKRLETTRQHWMQQTLQQLAEHQDLSPDVSEIVSKSLVQA